MISKDTILKIQENTQIEEVVGEFVSLKKRGVNLVGLCPFHDEKTPSFTVSPSKGIYKCFGCGAAGNAINFLMEHESYSYPEALRYLGDKYNIEVEDTDFDNEQDKADQQLKDSLYIINAFAQRYFTEILFEEEEGQTAGLAYCKERGFREDTIRKFQLGYALDQYESFLKAAQEKGYDPKLMEKAGLISIKGDRKTDFFRGRLLFPIHSLSGKVIGFGGRTLKSDKKIPKYINTPESEIYHKSEILYGIFFAKNAIRKEDRCYLVEGYTDVISLNQAGIENTVASSGTSLTPDQVKLVKRLTKNITILYDGDPAGIKAALRGIDLILEKDMDVKVVLLPEGEDPDSFVKTVGTTEFKKFVDERAQDFIFFKTDLLLKDSKNDPVKKTEVIREIVSSIALIPDTIKRSLFIRECSAALEMNEQILTTEVNKLRRRKFSKHTGASSEEAKMVSPDVDAEHEQRQPDGTEEQHIKEKELIRLLLEYGKEEIEENVTVTELILHSLEAKEFENPVYNKILLEYYRQLQQNEIPDQQYFLNHDDPEIKKLAIEILHPQYEISENWFKKFDIVITDKKFLFKKDIKMSLCWFKLQELRKKEDECRQKIKQAEKDKEEQELLKLQKRLVKLQEMKKQLADDLGTVVVK